MRENESLALQNVVKALKTIAKDLETIIGGNIPVKAAPAAAAAIAKFPRKAQAAAEPTGEANIGYDETSGGFGCLVCDTGPYKAGELAEHLWTEHGIPLSQVAGEGLTHGRKWQMKQYLLKNAPDALEGYGRGAKAEAPAEEAEEAPPVQKKSWAKKVAKPEVTCNRFSSSCLRGKTHNLSRNPSLKGLVAHWYPLGIENAPVVVEIACENKPSAQYVEVRRLDDGSIVSIPKKQLGQIFPYKVSEITPYKAAPTKSTTTGKKPWQKGGPAAAPSGNTGKFAEKYGLNDKQLKYVSDYASQKSLTLEQAAKDLELEEPGQEAE